LDKDFDLKDLLKTESVSGFVLITENLLLEKFTHESLLTQFGYIFTKAFIFIGLHHLGIDGRITLKWILDK
jgi:hypothetical protein